jgi:hypothetical protein
VDRAVAYYVVAEKTTVKQSKCRICLKICADFRGEVGAQEMRRLLSGSRKRILVGVEVEVK